jgi:hypothetical protein
MPGPELPPTPHVEAVLSSAVGISVRVGSVEHLHPWSVMRCRLAEPLPHDGATSVIVKWVRTDAGNDRTQPARLGVERAALEHVGARTWHLVPRVLGGPDTGLLVLEDLSPREPLRAIVLRDGATVARAVLIEFARALGSLHAATASTAGAYYERRGFEAPTGLSADLAASLAEFQVGVERLGAVGVPMSTAARHELAGVVDRLLDPGPLLALSNGDPETNNYLTDGSDGRLIDFESAGFASVFVDVASLYVPGPMWLSVGDPGADGRADAYRAALAEAVPAITDDRRFGEGVAGAAFVEALRRLVSLRKLDLRERGEPGRVHRVATTEAAADVAARFGVFPHLTAWMREVAAFLRHRWPDTDVDLSALPPFTSR